MKKLTTVLAVLFLLISASAFTTTGLNVSTKIKSEFQNDFASVSDVKWSLQQDIYIAEFKFKGEDMVAAYSEEGKLLGVAKYVALSQLPSNISLALQNKYAGYSIDQTIVELSGDETSYFINAENKKYKVRIQADTTGNLTVLSKTKKK